MAYQASILVLLLLHEFQMDQLQAAYQAFMVLLLLLVLNAFPIDQLYRRSLSNVTYRPILVRMGLT